MNRGESQERVLMFVKEFRYLHYGLTPSISEIQKALGYASPFSVQRALNILIKSRRLIPMGPSHKNRALVPVEEIWARMNQKTA